ncbi:MAG: PSD1 and planctomycete cytochrome C domain-containing protein [Phycisphaerales bacterium JB040]
MAEVSLGGVGVDGGGPAWEGVREILERRCLECHGGEERKSGLSFADGETFALGGGRGPAVDAGDPGASRLLHVIGYADPELAMPPGGKLPEGEIELLRAWVEAGAPWPGDDRGRLADPAAHPLESGVSAEDSDWWAYQALSEVEPPVVEDPAWGGTAIDRFIYNGLVSNDLTPGPLATPEQLLRRATYDLTGLPPTPEERREFLAAYGADADAAWAGLIDRLLASPAYAEHWARHWLDQVRYAETNGYERDATKTNIWRYRDWVIRALHEDMPYDRFLIEQLAGDELLASGGGRAPGVDETALLATGYFRLGVWDDEPADPVQARADELADIVDTTGQVVLGMTLGCARCHDHKADPISQRDYYAFTAFFNNVEGYGSGEFGQHLGGGMTRPVSDPPHAGQVSVEERDRRVRLTRERLLDLTGDASWGERGGETLLADARSEPVQWRWITGEPPADWFRQAFDDRAWAEGEAGFGTRGTPGARVSTEWDSRRITIRTRFRLGEIPAGVILSIHHDEDAEVYLNGVRVASLRGYTTDYRDIQLGREAVNALVVGSNTIAITCSQTGGGQYLDAGLRVGWLDTEEARVLRAESEARREAGVEGLTPEEQRRVRELVDELRSLERLPVAEPYAALVVSERGAEAPTQHVLFRGSAHAPGEAVQARVPTVLAWAGEPEFPEVGEASTGRRLALARWLTDEGSFLTARVAANRLWQFHFGRGLSRSSGDFGRLGQRPTHPALLDYLAGRLIERGWSLKAMHRELMLSRVYRLSSVASDSALATDPRNNYYSHADPRRLTAEQYRDSVLAVAGLLTERLYGPSVYPPLPEEVLATASRPDEAWGVSSEADARRRSVYVFIKRSLRPPIFENFDQPDPDISCPVRFPTNVPTQSLITLNGDFTHDAAAHLADRLLGETGSHADAVRLGVSLALGREADEAEVERHLGFLDELRLEYGLNDRDAMTVFALMLFNLNEFMWVD